VRLLRAQGDKTGDLYGDYVKRTRDQAGENLLIGIWSGSLCGRRIVLAIVANDNPKEGYRLRAVLLNGKEVGYGFINGDEWFYVSPMATEGVYEGRTIYRNRLFKSWHPNRVVMTGENVFTAYDDVTRETCGPTTNVYVRREPRPALKPAPGRNRSVSGTGFLILGSTLIVTAHHVVEGSATITVRFPSGDRYTASVVGRDVNNDLAVLRLAGFSPSDRGFSLNIQSPVLAGETVHALGYPLSDVLGEQPSIVSGQVSATTGLEDSPTQFRMTLPINPGNSGGPIINQYGDVVGIAVSALRGRPIEGIGFGVKIAAALSLFQQVGIKLDQKRGSEMRNASHLFAQWARDIVLIEAK